MKAVDGELVFIPLEEIAIPEIEDETQQDFEEAMNKLLSGKREPLKVTKKGSLFHVDPRQASLLMAIRCSSEDGQAPCVIQQITPVEGSLTDICDQVRSEFPLKYQKKKFDQIRHKIKTIEDFQEALDEVFEDPRKKLRAHFLILELDEQEQILIQVKNRKKHTQLKKALDLIVEKGVTVDSVIVTLLTSPRLGEWVDKRRNDLEGIRS